MRIVKHLRGTRKGLDFFVAESGGMFALEWSAATRERSGRSLHSSIAAALSEAKGAFGIPLESWSDGDPFECPPWRSSLLEPEPAAFLPDVWEFFSWSAPQVPDLVAALRTELETRISKHDREKEIHASDSDERSINRAWCDELAATLRQWCHLLEINPDNLPGYRKALRQNVWNEDLIRTDTIPQTVLAALLGQTGSECAIFRPRCLREANDSLLRWLQQHPSDVDRVHHRTFETIIAETLRSSGWTVELTKRTRDGGYDLMCLLNTSVGIPVKMIVETKLYALDRPVGLPMVDRLMGVRDRERVERAVLVTNSRITADVWTRWQDRVGRELTLIDRAELLEWLSDGKARIDTLTITGTQPTPQRRPADARAVSRHAR